MIEEVRFTQEEHLGFITLNRPQSLNALTLNMIIAIQKQLLHWQQDSNVHAIIVQAEAGGAFCAGGDIRSLYLAKNNPLEQLAFFWHEYRLNHFIHQLKKPYISLINGMVMGGGVGLSLHGSHAVATERFMFAMPETGIGFFPDIGASYLLTRCPGSLGVYLGLTGNRIGAQEARSAGLVRSVIAAEKIPSFLNALKAADLSQQAMSAVNGCLNEYGLDHLEEKLMNPRINDYFAHPSVDLIVTALQRSADGWAQEIAEDLLKKSPLSLKITLEQLHRAKHLSLKDCLSMDYVLVQHFMKGHDFYEGVRALLIDKDKQPKWQPEQLQHISNELVDKYFKEQNNLDWPSGDFSTLF